MTLVDGLKTRLAGLKGERLITPLTFPIITAFVVLMPAERSGWDLGGVVSFLTFFATTVAIFSIFTLGLNVQWGYTGVFNFGIAGFFLVGAFTAAIFTKGAPPPLDPVTGRAYVEYVGGFGDELDFLPFLSSREWLPFVFGTAGGPPLGGEPGEYKYISLLIVVAVLILVYVAVERAIRSPWGRVLRSLREDELATTASGKNVFAFKMQAFVFGAMIMGVGGALYAY